MSLIYLYKGSENMLVNMTDAMKRSGANNAIANPTILPEQGMTKRNSVYGVEELPPIDYSVLPNYQKISETHSNCINFKHRNVSRKGFRFHNTNAGKLFETLLLKSNERNESLYQVINKFVYSFIESGQSYLEVVGKKDNFMLYNSSPQNFRVLLNKFANKKMYYAYNLTFTDRKYIKAFYEGEQYFRFLHSLSQENGFSNFYGVPDWISALQSIEINYAIDTWLQSFVNNSARFDFLLVTSGQPLNDTQEQKIKNTLSGGKGVTNSGKGGYLAVDYDTNVQVIQLNNVNHSSFFEGKGEYIQQIIQSHGLSSQSVGFSNGGKSIAGNEVTGALRKDSETYIMPMQIMIEENLNKLFYDLTGINPDLRFHRMDVVSDKEKALIRDSDINNGIAPPSYFTRTFYPDLSPEEIAELDEMRKNKQNEQENDRRNFDEKPDGFDDTQNYERADRR